MMDGRVEAGVVSVEVNSGIEELELKVVNEVESGSECDGKGDVNIEVVNNDVVNKDILDNEEDDADSSYVLVSGSDMMVEDAAERGNVNEVSVELSGSEVLGVSGVKGDEVEGLDGGQKAEDKEDDPVNNGILLLSNDSEVSHVGECIEDEMLTGMVEEIEMVDEEAEQGEDRNTLEANETVEVESSNKLEDVQKTENVTPINHEIISEQINNCNTVENGDAEERHVGESRNGEMKRDMVEEIEIFNEEPDQGDVGNTLKAEEIAEVESSNKLEDVQKTVNVTHNNHESISEQIISGGAVGNGDAEESHVDDSVKDEMKTDMVEEIKMVDVEAEQGEVGNMLKAEETVEIRSSNKPEAVHEIVNIIPNGYESDSQLIVKAVENGDADIGLSNPNLEDKLNSEVEFIESNEPEQAMELEKEINKKYSPAKKGNQDSEDLVESETQCNEKMPSDVRESLLELEQAGNISLIDESLSGRKFSVNIEPHLNEEGHHLVIESEVSTYVKENGNCQIFIPADDSYLNSEEQNNSANILSVESNAEFADAVTPSDHDIEHDIPTCVNSKMRPVSDGNVYKIDSDASSSQIEKPEVANIVSTEQEENGLECETQADVTDSQTTEIEQTLSKAILLNSVNQENGLECETQADINDDLPSYLATECAVEVVEPVTETSDNNVPIDNEWPELSYYTAKRKIYTELVSKVPGSQESEEIHMADRDRKTVHNGSREDDNVTSLKKETINVSLCDSEKACPDIGTNKEINLTGPSTNWADYNDQIDGVSSSSVLSTSSHSNSISDGVANAANHENDVATSESGSKDDETKLNRQMEASKVETASEVDPSLGLVESEVERRPFFFLIKVPRLEDDEIREKIKFAQQDVEEKTRLRDSYKVPIQTKKTVCMEFTDDLEAAKLKEKAARDNLKAKRKEIDAAQAVIDKVNNAMTVEDIDGSIHVMEHRMQHETVPLNEEKQLMREIKRLKHFKEQLSSSIGTQEELQEALDQKDLIRDHLKSLKRDLNLIRSDVQRTEIVTKAAKKKCFDEYAELNQLQFEYKAADGVRQEAFLYLVSLRRELAQKNKFFWMYKDTEKLANDYALSGDKKGLHSLCVNQVETVMNLWNTDDQFRNDYIKCNARSTLRRLKTLDGRSLGFNEEPPSLAPYLRNDRINHSEVVTNSLSQFPPPAELKIHVPFIAEKVVNEPVLDISEKKVAKTQSKSTVAVSEVSTVSSFEITPVTEEEVKKTKEEEQAEEIRKKEEEARLMEQLQLEERAKAKEALERKQRMAERAQARAKLRAKKEAEQREKEREKRIRKKEKRKEGKDNGVEKDLIAVNEPQSEATKEADSTEKPTTKRHHKPSHYIKGTKTSTMPLNLRNRHRRKMQMWMWMSLAAIAAVAFVSIWFGYHSYLAEQKRTGH